MISFKKQDGYNRDYTVFARLFDSNRKEAYKYRFETLWDPIPEEYLDKEVKQEVKEPIKEPESLEIQLKDEYKKILKEANVKFHPSLGTDKLKVLCQENWLID